MSLIRPCLPLVLVGVLASSGCSGDSGATDIAPAESEDSASDSLNDSESDVPVVDSSVPKDAVVDFAETSTEANDGNDAETTDVDSSIDDTGLDTVDASPDSSVDSSTNDGSLDTNPDSTLVDSSANDASPDSAVDSSADDTSPDTIDASIDLSLDSSVDVSLDIPDTGDLPLDASYPVDPPHIIYGTFDTQITIGSFTLQSAAAPGITNAYLARVESGKVAWAVRIASPLTLEGGPIAVAADDGTIYVGVDVAREDDSTIPDSGSQIWPVIFEGTYGPKQAGVLSQAKVNESFLAAYDHFGGVRWVRRFGFAPGNAAQWPIVRNIVSVRGLDAVGGMLTILGKKYPDAPSGTTTCEYGADGFGLGAATFTTDTTRGYAWWLDVSSLNGAPFPASFGIAASDSPAGTIGVSYGGHQNGVLTLTGASNLPGAPRYYANYSSASPMLINGAMASNGWIAKIHRNGNNDAIWAYGIGTDSISANVQADIGAPTTLASGDVILGGYTTDNTITFHHGSGKTTIPTTMPGYPPGSGWLARYASDGSKVLWAKTLLDSAAGYTASIGNGSADESTDAYFTAGSGSDTVLVGVGEANESVLGVGNAGSFLLRLATSSGELQWARAIRSNTSVRTGTVELEGNNSLIVFVEWTESVTFDPGGVAELTSSAPGQVVYGFMRYSRNGQFLSFTETHRRPKAAAPTEYSINATAVQAR